MGIKKISVIMPSLNSGEFIEEALISCLNQDELLEIIIVDGGSKNDTISRIKKFQEIHTNIQLIIEKDNGPSQALNKALLKVKGEFVAWLNSDDKFEINSFQRSLSYFDKNQNCKIVYGHGQHIDQKGSFIEYYPTFEPNIGIDKFQDGCFICQPTILFRNQIIRDVGGFDENLKTCFDFDFWLRIFKFYNLSDIGFVNAVQASTRLHKNTITSKNYWRVNIESAIILNKYLGYVKDHWLEQAARFCILNNKNYPINFSEDSELNQYFERNLKNIYDNFMDKFINGNQLILNNRNNKNDYPISLKKILSERIDLQKCGYHNSQNERDFCIWLINHGAEEYPYLFEGTFRNNIVLDWFSKNNRENIPRIIQAIWDSNYKLQKIGILKKFKTFLKYFLIFKWDKFLINPNLSYESFFNSNTLGLNNLIRFSNLLKLKKIYANKIKVSLVGHVNYQSGIGQDVRKTYLALKLRGIKSEIIDFGLKKNNREIKGMLQFIKGNHKNYDKEILILCLNPNDCFNYLSSKRNCFFDRKYIIGYIPWEFDIWPAILNDLYSYFDEIWISSKFTYRAFREFEKIKKIMPLCVDNPEKKMKPLSNKSKSYYRNKYNLPQTNFIYLCSFDLESYITRKNPWAVINSFQKAFNPNYPDKPINENVNLLIKTFKPISYNRDWEILKNIIKLDDRIIIIEENLDYYELLNLYGSCDALISLHRSEGFGRIIVECINLGLEIICTNWGGNTDFCNNEFTHLVPYKKIDVIPGTYPFWEGQKWADPDIDKAAEYINDIYKGKRLNKKNFREKIRNKFSLENTGYFYSQRIKEIIENLS